MIASAGQEAWQAVTISPSRMGRFCFSASIRALLTRCTQYVHFSITPRLRTVTSGFRNSLSWGVSQSWTRRKLKRRTLYGQLFEQYRVQTQRLYTISFRPSALCTVAPTGQTCSHGAFSHCWHGTGWKNVSGFASASLSFVRGSLVLVCAL